jgi:hypothetical protein
MHKLRHLATAFIYAAVVFLATPAYATSKPVNSPAQPHHQETVSNSASTFAANQSADNYGILTDSTVLSDELWLVFSALLALAGIIMAHRTAKQTGSHG